MKFLFLVFLIFSSSFSDDLINDKDGVALDGFDVVAYFKNAKRGIKKGIKGLEKFSVEYAGVKYYFSNQKNKEAFEKNPEDFLPAYGGWCAWAVAQGKNEVPVNFNSFIVKKDNSGRERLFLFYKTWLSDTEKKWKKASHIEQVKKADKNWHKFKAGEHMPAK